MSRGTKWEDFKKENDILTPEETEEIRVKIEIIDEILKARKGKGISQKELESISGVKQPLIARIEKGNVDPQITTILRILKPLGLTLAVVPERSKLGV